MKIHKAIKIFQEGDSLLVSGKTFPIDSLEVVRLETDDDIYWVRDGGDLWLSVDPESEEIIVFNTVEEEVDASGESVYYKGEDYEFDFETVAHILEDGEKTDKIIFRDFSRSDGEVLRVSENTVSNEVETAIGTKITEDDLRKGE